MYDAQTCTGLQHAPLQQTLLRPLIISKHTTEQEHTQESAALPCDFFSIACVGRVAYLSHGPLPVQ